MWPFVSPEQWAEWCVSQGYDPTQFTYGSLETVLEPVNCAICNGEMSPDKLYLLVDPPPGIPFGRKFHADCLISHFYLNASNMSDEIINYALRKKFTS